jgi:hypothetical protein
MTKLFWIAGLAGMLGGGAVASAPTVAGPVGGHLNPGEIAWAATTGNPTDLEDVAVSEERAPAPADLRAPDWAPAPQTPSSH